MSDVDLAAPALVGEFKDPAPVSVQVLREGPEVCVFVDRADAAQTLVVELKLSPEEARATAAWLVQAAHFAERNAD